MINGIDISNHQNWQDAFLKQDFVIMKASEGVTYKDTKLDSHYNKLHGSTDGKPDKNKLYGFYHFARPENGNSYQKEADHFLSLVGHHAGYAMFVLDVEGSALNTKYTSWCKNWLDYVYKKTGVKPLLYIQASAEWTDQYKSIRTADYGLWVAHYTNNAQPTVKHWKPWAMWQYSDSQKIGGVAIDKNVFNGTKDQFRAYCKKN